MAVISVVVDRTDPHRLLTLLLRINLLDSEAASLAGKRACDVARKLWLTGPETHAQTSPDWISSVSGSLCVVLLGMIKLIIKQTTTCHTLTILAATRGLRVRYKECGSRWQSFEVYYILVSMWVSYQRTLGTEWLSKTQNDSCGGRSTGHKHWLEQRMMSPSTVAFGGEHNHMSEILWLYKTSWHDEVDISVRQMKQ